MNDQFVRHVPQQDGLPHERLTLKDILRLTKTSRSQIYKLLKKREFPAPIKLGRTVRWVRAEVQEYLQQQEDAR